MNHGQRQAVDDVDEQCVWRDVSTGSFPPYFYLFFQVIVCTYVCNFLNLWAESNKLIDNNKIVDDGNKTSDYFSRLRRVCGHAVRIRRHVVEGMFDGSSETIDKCFSQTVMLSIFALVDKYSSKNLILLSAYWYVQRQSEGFNIHAELHLRGFGRHDYP